MLSNDRRALTKLKFFKISENKYYVEEENLPAAPTSKSTWISEMNTMMILEIMGPKIIKITLESCLNAKGYCRQSDSRAMLIQLYSDIVFINKKYSSLKSKGKLQFNLDLHKIYSDNLDTESLSMSNVSFFKSMNEDSEEVESCRKNVEVEEVFYSISGKEKNQEDGMSNPYQNLGIVNLQEGR